MMARLRNLIARYEIATSGYFDTIGWFRTRASRHSLDAAGQPIPWFTYPAVAFLSERVRREWRVLEFGAGMGTQWWARHVDHHVALEHDAGWAKRVAEASSALVLATSDRNAAQYIAPASSLGTFEVVIVDGLFRNECLLAACDLVAANGVILLDDAQRTEYAPAVDAARARGFRWLPFYGPQPVSKHAGCTGILYRPGNVLNL